MKASESNGSIGAAPIAVHADLTRPVHSWPEYLYRLQTDDVHYSASIKFIDQHWHVSVLFSALYVVLLFVGLRWMRKRDPFNLRLPLACWSALLSIFSLLGTIAVWPEFVSLMWNEGFVATYCDNSYTNDRRLVYWYTVFVLSKVAELLDTAFIVLRKQRLIPLHWVHHVLTLCYSFYVYRDSVSTARWMVSMNFAIHTVMYGYYSLKALRVRIGRPVMILITTGQIVQMVFGLYINSHILLGGLAGTSKCACSWRASVAGFALYALFFYYFVRFFVDAYLSKPHQGKVITEKVVPAAQCDLNNNDLILLQKKSS